MEHSQWSYHRWRVAVWFIAATSLFTVAAWLGYVHFVIPLGHESVARTSHASVRIYNSLGRLSEVADLVVIGEVAGVVSRQADTGGDGLAEAIPSTWYEVEVQETLKGEATDTITVVRTDPGYFQDAHVTMLQPGESVVLYLMKRTTTEFPLVTSADVFYVPVSFDNGVFDVVPNSSGAPGEKAIRPRVSNLFGADTFTKAEMQQAASGR